MNIMLQEILSIPQLLRQQWDAIANNVEQVADVLSRRSIQRTNQRYYAVGWGSSGFVADWFRYAAADLCAWPVLPWSMALPKDKSSVLLDSASCLILFSQSGASSDLCNLMKLAVANDALGIACVNKPESNLAGIANMQLPVHAGLEQSIAATKSFFLSATAILYLISRLNDDKNLLNALHKLPDLLEQQTEINIYHDMLVDVEQLTILSHGYTESIAGELALKFKETCLINAEALSYSSFLHGPAAMLAKPTNLLALLEMDSGVTKGVFGATEKLANFGTSPLCIAPAGIDKPRNMTLLTQYLSSEHKACSSLLMLYQAYRTIAECMQARGLDPNKSIFLRKETITE